MELEDIIEETKPTGNIDIERRLVINAIMSTDFMKGAYLLLRDLSLIESTVCRTILGWSCEYYKKYSMAMGETVQTIYEQKRAKLSETVSKDLSDFLTSVSQQYASGDTHIYNVALELDVAEDYIDKQNLLKLKNNIDKAMLTNNLPKAKQHVNNYNQVKQVANSAIDGMEDFSRFREEKEKDEVLFEMPFPFNQSHGEIRRRAVGFVVGAAKSGKSYKMSKIASEALRNNLSVLIISCEMSESEFLRRIDAEIIRESLKGGSGYVPVIKGQGSGATIQMKEVVKQPHTPEEMEEKWRAWRMFHPHARLFVKEYAQLHCSIDDDIESQIDYIRETEGVNIDVLIVDYLDLLKPIRGEERLDQHLKIGNLGKRLKKLAQEKSLFVFTGSQINRQGDMAQAASKEQDLSWAVRIEQNSTERRLGIFREYVMFHRNLDYQPNRAMVCTGNLGMGMMNLDGIWLEEDADLVPDIDIEGFRLWTPNTGEEWRTQAEETLDDYY